MSANWNLDSLYPGFSSRQFQEDSAAALRLSQELEGPAADDASVSLRETIQSWLERMEAFESLWQKLSAYAELRFSADTRDEEAARCIARLQELRGAALRGRTAMCPLLSTREARRLIDGGAFGEHTYYLKDLLREQARALPPREEALLAALELTGSSAWAGLHTRAAAQTQTETTIQISAAALNAIKGEVLTVCRLRGCVSPLQAALEQYHFDPRILDGQMEAVEEYLPRLRRYFRLKAQKLGCPAGLPYDMREQLILHTEQEFSLDAAKTLILDAFAGFSPQMRRFGEAYFASGWIDSEVRPGKAVGASCDAIWQAGESRLRIQYRGTVGDANCLAHELGHGYHFQRLFGQSTLNCRYDLPVAEVASKFSELLFQEHLRQALPEQERLFCEEFTLSSCINTIVDISARFRFESELFSSRTRGTLSVEDLDRLMLQAQRDSYGDTLDPERQNVRTWVTKPHYYSAQRSFYNFPYQFGTLLSLQMLSAWKQDPVAFTAAYDRFLSSTGTCDVLDLCRIIGMDLLSPAFFVAPLQSLAQRLEDFEHSFNQAESPDTARQP